MELNEELFEKVNNLIFSLLQKVLGSISIEEQETINKEILEKHVDERKRVLEIFHTVEKTFEKLKDIDSKEKIFEPYEIPHFLNYEYLILTEGILTQQINLICYLLIRDGNEFVNRWHKKVENLKDLKNTYLSDKMKFLERCNFGIFAEHYDNKLRNAIAHVDYDIDKDGFLYYKENKINIIEFQQKIFDLMDLTYCISESFERFYKRYKT